MVAKPCPFCGMLPVRFPSGYAHPGDHQDDSCPMNGRAIRNLPAWNMRLTPSGAAEWANA